MNTLLETIFTASFGYAVLRVTTPILFAALAAQVSKKAGVNNIALEGTMLTSALTGVIVSAYTNSAWIGLLGAIIAGIAMAMILAYSSLKLKANIILSGIALNLMASGGTVFVLYLVAHDKGISSSLKSHVLPKITLPIIDRIPVIGTILSGHNILTYFSLIAVVLIYFLIYRMPIGYKIRAVGENKDAADSVGISVIKIQYIALLMSGALAGLGGAYMSMGYVSWFSTNMTSGRGFIALAAEAMGGGTPFGILLSSLFFGLADALSNSLQSIRIPSEFIQAIPYVATIIGLIVYSSNQTSKVNKLKSKHMEKETVN